MAPWHEALRTFRRRSLQDNHETSDVMFVLCSENHAAAAVLASLEPAIVLQTFGGARAPSEASTRSAFEYAIGLKGVRRVVVCGHLGCQAVALDDGADARTATQADVVAQCRRLRQDARIGGLLADHRVSLHAIWFDAREGDVYACDIEGRAATLMSDEDFGRLTASSGKPSP